MELLQNSPAQVGVDILIFPPELIPSSDALFQDLQMVRIRHKPADSAR